MNGYHIRQTLRAIVLLVALAIIFWHLPVNPNFPLSDDNAADMAAYDRYSDADSALVSAKCISLIVGFLFAVGAYVDYANIPVRRGEQKAKRDRIRRLQKRIQAGEPEDERLRKVGRERGRQ